MAVLIKMFKNAFFKFSICSHNDPISIIFYNIYFNIYVVKKFKIFL